MSLPIGHQQTISQPFVVAKMTELLIQGNVLDQKPLGAVLEIGTGQCRSPKPLLKVFGLRHFLESKVLSFLLLQKVVKWFVDDQLVRTCLDKL